MPRPRGQSGNLVAVRRLLALGLLLLLLPACSGDDGGDGRPPSRVGTRAARAGLIVGQQPADGDLADTLELLDPERPGDETIDRATDVARGIPVGVQQALYESGDASCSLDAETRRGPGPRPADRRHRPPRSPGPRWPAGGERYVVLLAPTGEGAALVDLDDGRRHRPHRGHSTDPSSSSAPSWRPTARRPAEHRGRRPPPVPTDDPDGAERLGDGAGQLLDDGAVRAPHQRRRRRRARPRQRRGRRARRRRRRRAGRGRPRPRRPATTRPSCWTPARTRSSPQRRSARVAPPRSRSATRSCSRAATSRPGRWSTATRAAPRRSPDLDGLTPAFSGRPERWVPFGRRGEPGRRRRRHRRTARSMPILDLGDDERDRRAPLRSPATGAAGHRLDLGRRRDPRRAGRPRHRRRPRSSAPASRGRRSPPTAAGRVVSGTRDAELRVAPVDDVGRRRGRRRGPRLSPSGSTGADPTFWP